MSFEKTIWVLESDPVYQKLYDEVLGHRYALRVFSCPTAFEHAFEEKSDCPHLFFAELKLHAGSLISFLETAPFARGPAIPFIVASAIDDTEIVRLCFKKGARDYLTKPLARSELIVKTERIFNEQRSRESFAIDPISLRVTRKGQSSLPLTSKEFQILTTLRQATEQTLTREELVYRVWNAVRVGSKTLDVHLFHLRKKLLPLRIEIVFRSPNSYSVREPVDVRRAGALKVHPESLPAHLTDSPQT